MTNSKVKVIKNDPDAFLRSIVSDLKIRRAVTRQSHFWFFHVYFAHFAQHPTAPFQMEMFHISEDVSIETVVLKAFRGSAKSTIFTLSYPIWAILDAQQKKCAVIISQTQNQAKLHLNNLKKELETNGLLRQDLGPFEQKDDEWSAGSLVIPKHGARIIALSTEQNIRGIRHGAHRPDLVICDDIEDSKSVQTYEGRQRTREWLTKDVIPAMSDKSRLIIVGSLLHEDSLLCGLERQIKEGTFRGRAFSYPIVDENGEPLWKSRFPDQESIEKLRLSIGDDIAWSQEYLLKSVSDTSQVVDPDWIQFYEGDPLLGKEQHHRMTIVSVDLAISNADHADYTAIVIGRIIQEEKHNVLYILPDPVNKRMRFPEIIASIKAVAATVDTRRTRRLLVEDVGYQRAAIEQLQVEGVYVEGIRPMQDKRARLALTTDLIRNGRIKFPTKGAELLLAQMTGFGRERHDDLVDAFSMMVLETAGLLNRSRSFAPFVGGERRPDMLQLPRGSIANMKF